VIVFPCILACYYFPAVILQAVKRTLYWTLSTLKPKCLLLSQKPPPRSNETVVSRTPVASPFCFGFSFLPTISCVLFETAFSFLIVIVRFFLKRRQTRKQWILTVLAPRFLCFTRIYLLYRTSLPHSYITHFTSFFTIFLPLFFYRIHSHSYSTRTTATNAEITQK